MLFRSVKIARRRDQISLAAHSSLPLKAIAGPFVFADQLDLDQGVTELHEEEGAAHWEQDVLSLSICYALVHSEVLRLVDQCVLGSDIVICDALARRIVLLFSILRYVPSDAVRDTLLAAGESITVPWAKTLEEIYKKLAPSEAAYRCGLVYMCLQLSALLGDVTLVAEESEDYLKSKFNGSSVVKFTPC